MTSPSDRLSALRRLGLHVSHYTLGNFLVALAGLVSFPLLTRLLSTADYGLMNLISATILILVAVGKLGMQHSIIRYQSQAASGCYAFDLRTFRSTMLLTMGGMGFAVTLLWFAASWLLPVRWFGDPHMPVLFAATSVLIFFGVLESVFTNFLRAEQRSSHLVSYQVVKRWVGLGLVVGALLFVTADLMSFYAATIVTEVAGFATLIFLALGRNPATSISRSAFSRPLLAEMLRFGIPMMLGYELSGIVLSVGDRYVVQALLGEESLGIYAAAYNLCQYVQTIVISSVAQAIMPIYIRIWDEQGKTATQEFINNAFIWYVLLAAPAVAGMAAVGPDLLLLLASSKYAIGSVIIPWVVAGMAFESVCALAGAGLFIERQSRIIMGLVILSAAFNVVLNILLIPRIGLLGPALATLASYTALSLAMVARGAQWLPVRVPWGSLVRACLASALMFELVSALHFEESLIRIIARVGVGAIIYSLLIIAIEPRARVVASLVWRRLTSCSLER